MRFNRLKGWGREDEESVPWLNPVSTRDALDLLDETAQFLRTLAEFGHFRKDLRLSIEDKARKCEEFVLRNAKPAFDPALVRGFINLQSSDGDDFDLHLNRALEMYVSAVNLSKAKKK